jgi:serine/threonine-protein kinase SRPK3
VHGHALLEGDVEGSGSDIPEALRSGMSSSAMGEEGEEVASSDGDGDGTDEDFSDTANERQKEYRPGGYHPVYIGEVYNERYRVVHKLGWGYFSTVWLVWDYKGHGFHAMKVQKSAQHYRDAAYDEIKLLTQIMGADPTSEHCCARMTDSFEHIGPHGTHVVMIFDVLGENLLKLMERYEYKGIPIPIVKAIAKQTLIGLRHIHSIEIIHTDLKPENVLLQTPKHGIVNIMKRYKAPAVSENLSLLERDRSMMTKSQRRRYDAKVRKLKREANEKQGDAPAAAADASESGSDEGSSKKAAVVDPSRAAERSADGGGIDAQDLSAEVSAGVKAAEAAVNASDSDTDPEWEVQRFQNVCLADFGNSCWTYKQFADEVQTRQYRCPEVIIGDPYGCAIDLWSAACMFFELLTGEFLFDPKESGEYPRDEDHLALIMELQGPLPPHMAMGRGKFRSQFFNSHGELRHIKDLRFWGIRDVLHKKYRFSNKKANEIAEFLLPMLALDPRERATAAEMLEEFADFFDPVDDDFAPACFSTGESDDEEEEAERMPRPFSCRQEAAAADDGEDEEDDIETWLANHPLLHPDQLASMGLKLDDVTTVLQGGTLPDPRKQQIVDMIIERMQDDMATYEDEDEAAAAGIADEEEEEEEDEAATTDEDTTGSEASAEKPAVASTNAHVDPQAGTTSE